MLVRASLNGLCNKMLESGLCRSLGNPGRLVCHRFTVCDGGLRNSGCVTMAGGMFLHGLGRSCSEEGHCNVLGALSHRAIDRPHGQYHYICFLESTDACYDNQGIVGAVIGGITHW